MTAVKAVEQVKALAPAAEVDPVADPFTRSRVYFRSVDDLAPLRPLFVAARKPARRLALQGRLGQDGGRPPGSLLFDGKPKKAPPRKTMGVVRLAD